ncbi:hypothetical protein LCGC14_0146860 [marine sediment metagenome]|uniref:Uncharacterized protein n=1 Tax=marine sediment metagenome TaxID=412755 RepID=A0A0F9V3K1_9ZZZZ
MSDTQDITMGKVAAASFKSELEKLALFGSAAKKATEKAVKSKATRQEILQGIKALGIGGGASMAGLGVLRSGSAAKQRADQASRPTFVKHISKYDKATGRRAAMTIRGPMKKVQVAKKKALVKKTK